MHLDPSLLPSISSVRQRAQALAMLDAIICPEWADRYFSFDTHWSSDTQMGSMRNGSGDDWFILFGDFGAAIKGLAHESAMASNKALLPALHAQLPAAFAPFTGEPAFSFDHVSYCYWRAAGMPAWNKVAVNADGGETDDGSAYLALLAEPALSYVDYASDYFELALPTVLVERIYAHEPLSPALVAAINPDLAWDDACSFAGEIGYPVTPG